MGNEKIFVVVPVYKVEPYLEQCVDSILKQTYTNWELVLVDDGSPDNCPAICDRYAAEHGNITVIHQDNGGLSAARNAGIEYALKHGDLENNWISFIDSDDFVHPCYLEYLYRAVKETGTDVSSCGYVRGETPVWLDMTYKADCLSPEEYWCKKYTNSSVACGKLYRMSLFIEIRYPLRKLYEDGYTTHKLLFANSKIAVIWMSLYNWRVNPTSITQSSWSPSQIDAICALVEQMEYLQLNGYSQAYKTSVQAFFNHTIKHLACAKALSPKYDSYIKELTSWRNHAFSLYKREYGILKAIIYWFDVRILRRLRQLSKK